MPKQRQITTITPALLDATKLELSKIHSAAVKVKQAAQTARKIKAAKAAAEEKKEREAEASKAAQELHNKKAELLHQALQQMAQHCNDEGGVSQEGSHKKQKLDRAANGNRNAAKKRKPQAAVIASADPTVCADCSTPMEFCKDPCCVSLHCEHCFKHCIGDPGFVSCTECAGSADCELAGGPLCHLHGDCYLRACESDGCDTVGCWTAVRCCGYCEDGPFCDYCLERGACETCQQEDERCQDDRPPWSF